MFLRILLFLAAFPLAVSADPGARILVGLTGGESDDQHFSGLAENTRKALIERGFPEKEVKILKGEKRDALLKELDDAAGQYDGEFWLVLLGHSGAGRDGVPAFQVSGPRLGANDLADALEKFKGPTFVFIGTGRSAEYIPFLKRENTTVLSATAGGGEINQPRFAEKWVDALVENPTAPFPQIAASADESVKQEYETLNLARGEHARLFDGTTGEILEAPFGADLASISTTASRAAAPPRITAADIEIPKPSGNSEFELLPPSDETRALIAEAAAVPNPEGHAALLLRQEIDLTVNSDQSTAERRSMRIFLAEESSFDDWANFSFPQNPPIQSTRMEGARLILPDGSSYVLNPSQALKSDATTDFPSAPGFLFFPQVLPGSIVEIAFRIENRPDMTLPAFYRELELQQSIPVLQSSVTLRIPKNQTFGHRIANLDAAAETSETEHSSVSHWKLDALPAFEPLPFEPPRRTQIALLEISSFASWDQFTDWFQRISEGAFDSGPEVKSKAAEIAAAHSSREERIRAAYEFVSKLRYVAIEFGIHAFRPRTPEQVLHQRYGDCKDKANLLVALLREMEIEAFFVLINRGDYTDTEFPGWQFNHAIAVVPNGEEDLWLDSTDTITPFGFLAPGNIGRSALVFSEDKAEFKMVASAAITTVRDEADLKEAADGKWSGSFAREYSGLAAYTMRSQFNSLSPRQRQFALISLLHEVMPTAEFSDVSISGLDQLAEPVRIVVQITAAGSFHPHPALEFDRAFILGDRATPLVINDGQSLRFEQEIKLQCAEPQPFTALHSESTIHGAQFSIQQAPSDSRNVSITASAEFLSATLAPEEYPEVRAALREWSSSLQSSHAK